MLCSWLRCYSNKDDFWVNHDGSRIRFAFAMDMAERVPSVFEPDLIYLLNSKRWLAKAIGEAKDMHANDLCMQAWSEEGQPMQEV